MKVPSTLDLNPRNRESLNDFLLMFKRKWETLTGVINGRLSLGDGTNPINIDLVWCPVTTPATPGDAFTVTHNLGRVPVGYLIVSTDKVCDVYYGGVVATSTELTLKASTASASIKLVVF